jgi:hypothetical protein
MDTIDTLILGRVNKFVRDSLAEPNGGTIVGGVDEKAMSVQGILCTTRIDADGDMVEPAGLILDRHKANPIVCLNHNVRGLPVARAVDKDGNYTVYVAKTQFPNVTGIPLVGTAYFTNSTASGKTSPTSRTAGR